MDIFNLIRSGIFLVAGLVTIIFGKQLNNLKNRLFKRLNYPKFVRDERKSYIYLGIVFIIISIILFVFAINN